MTKIEELQEEIRTLRENGAEQEDIAQKIYELNLEIARSKVAVPNVSRGGGKKVTDNADNADNADNTDK